MSDLVIVSRGEIEALQKHFNDNPEEDIEYAYVKCDDLRDLIDKANPVSGEAVYQLCFNNVWFDVTSCTYDKESVYEKRILYTSPQPIDTDTIALNASREVMKVLSNVIFINKTQTQANIQLAIIEAMKGK